MLRKAYRLADGTRADLALMAILKSEWEARAGGSCAWRAANFGKSFTKDEGDSISD